jgi:putative RecB family exonuclease
MTCPLLYRFRVLDQLPEPPSIDAVRGTLVHSVLERLFDLEHASRSPEAALDLIDPEWKLMLEESPDVKELFGHDEGALQKFMDEAGVLVKRYFTLENPALLTPAQRELHVEYQRDDGLYLHGYIDRLDVNDSGQVRIVDYKTGKSPKEGWESKAFFQMKFYALIMWRTTGQVPLTLQIMYLGDETILRYQPDVADLEATERKIVALWSAISQALETGVWKAQSSPLCGWCSFQAFCPEFNGTPPPLPALPPEATNLL